MELAGLEPAASWVRSRRSPALSLACLRGFRGGGGPVRRPGFGLISAHFGWDRAKERGLWPDLSVRASTGVGRALWWSARPARGSTSSDAAYRASGCVPESGKLLKASGRDRGQAAAVGRDRVVVPACCGGEARQHDRRASGDQEGRSSLGRSGRRSRPAGRLALYLGLAQSAAVGVHSAQRRAAVAGMRRASAVWLLRGTSTRRSRGAVPPAHRSRERLVPARSEDCCWPRFAAAHVGVASATRSN
jgi:hypothetical protein